VRHEHHRAGVVGEKVFEPRDGVDVEVIRRFVEQKQVGLRDQRAREEDAAPPSAGQGIDDRLGRQAESGENQFDALLEPPPVPLFEFVLQPSQSLQRGV
jgi:hypothetical protein